MTCITESVLKRVINNGLTGSSLHFDRFLYRNIKTVKVTDQFIWQDVSICLF